jgi:hypothetical protein
MSNIKKSPFLTHPWGKDGLPDPPREGDSGVNVIPLKSPFVCASETAIIFLWFY